MRYPPFRQSPLQASRRAIKHLWSSVGLGMKMATIVVIGTLSLLGLFAYLGTTALNENIQRTLQERIVLAQTTARHIDYVVAAIEDILTDTAAQSMWRDPQRNERNLMIAYQRLKFYITRVFLLDPAGNVIAAYPPISSTISFDQFASVQAVLGGRPFATSRYLRSLGEAGSATLAAAPIRDETGRVTGALVVSMDLVDPHIRTFSDPAGLGKTGQIDLIDLGGTILASTKPERIGTQSDHQESLATMIREQRERVAECHDCHTNPEISTIPTRQVLAFAPLERAPWGVVVRQSEEEVFASIRQLQMRIFGLMVIMLAGALALVYLTTQSVIVPVQALTKATQRIAAGDLDTPLDIHGQDEIGTLTQSFETMRIRLKESIAEIQRWNRDLDERVNERTAAVEKAKAEIMQLYEELSHKEQLRRELLNRVLAAQEEERKRISRELHDETCQVLTGLSYALDDVAEMTTEPAIKPQLERMHALTNTALEELHRIILDLRPTMLDHLGLIPALRWYAEARFNEKDIRFTLRETGAARRLSPTIETALFRVVQEAINNIARHADAIRAEIVFQYMPDRLHVTVADDGKGFDVNQVFDQITSRRGLGLLGMQERIDAIGGQLTLRSAPGVGTLVQITIPLEDSAAGEEHDDAKTHTHLASG
jgi:signal transduction histidine kinase